MKSIIKHPLLVAISLAATHILTAEVSLNRLFSDGMIIQQQTAAPIWGWATPDEEIQITGSWGATIKTTTKNDGTWAAKLNTPKAGGPFTITVEGDNKIIINDVLAGEVWFCGGQSNMDFTMQQIRGRAREPKYQPIAQYVYEEVKNAEDPYLRHIEVPNTPSPSKANTNFEGQWRSVTPGNTELMTATGYFFARELREALNVPVGIVECAWGGTRVEPWISQAAFMADPAMTDYFENETAKFKQRAEKWDPEQANKQHQEALVKWEANGQKGRKPQRQNDPSKDKQWPASLEQGMLSAARPFAIKGVIWYQGESNTGHMTHAYEHHFSTLIKSWRKEWQQGEFPFYWVQLAAFKDANDNPIANDPWASICDQQRRCLQIPNTGMAVANDIGEAKDIHPRNKVDVGKRLANWALVDTYGDTLRTRSGPLYDSHSIEGNTVTIRFNEVGSGLMVGNKHLLEPTTEVEEPLKRFQIAGKDGVWKWATARITSKDTIDVSHPEINEPLIVRYAWAPNPEGANLYNKEGLPASMFTTE